MSSEIACHGCDLLVNIGGLQDGESASCPRCGQFLTCYREDAFSRTLAYTIAATILLILANSYSFLSFSANGLENAITLLETPGALWEYEVYSAAIIVAAFILAIPAAVLAMLLALCLPLSRGIYLPWLGSLAKGVFLSQNWAMVEVFIIGVIVSLVKIAEMADVTLGISFWAYTAFALCFTLAVSSLDRYQCWEALEDLEQA
ncbi:MAG: hypothetical protein Hals2KO_18660 [Halioglobus sp.]